MADKFKDIPNSEGWISVDLVNKGWSSDIKYHVKTKDNKELLLRISDISVYNRKKEEYEALKRIDKCNILMSRPIAFGLCNNNNNVYTLLTWVRGMDAELKISTLSFEEQYHLGCEAGRLLRKLHEVPAPENLESWSERFSRKIDKKIKNYNECEIKIEKATKMIEYINANRYLLENRTQSFQHGDYHIGNMVVNDNNDIGIIDFNRYDYGDPWEEFNRIVWCADISPYFASGRIDGYFEGEVPEEFFRLMALYIANNTLSAVPWAVPFGEAEVKVMLDQAQNVLRWYDDFNSHIPKWYINFKDASKE